MTPRARAAALHRRARRQRRPDLAHDGRHRRARPHGPLRRPGDADRPAHHASSPSPRRSSSARSPPCRASSASRDLDRHAVVPPPAPAGYLWERAAYAAMAGTVGETVDGGRTVEALRLGECRARRVDADLADAYAAERRTLYLRTVWFPTVEIAYVLPVAASLAWGGWLVSAGPRLARRGDDGRPLRPGARRPSRPADLVARRDPGRRDVVRAADRRREGPRRPPSPRARSRSTSSCAREDVRYAYVDDRDVLHGIDLELGPGERIAVVGPSGAGKSTLGRLLAGIHPPRTGTRRRRRRAPGRPAPRRRCGARCAR